MSESAPGRSQDPRAGHALAVLIPTFNDWEALSHFLPALDRELSASNRVAHLLIVDDGSTDRRPAKLMEKPSGFSRIEVLTLARNLGHQRAIAAGICHLVKRGEHDGILILDGDGEDRASDVPRLLEETAREPGAVVFAARTRRTEGPMFAFFYALYRLIHWLLTGIKVRMGNFSFLPSSAARRLVTSGELWNHYAAAVVQSRLPYRLVPCERGRRVSGRTKMAFPSLVAHGLSAMAVFADRIGARALVVAAVLFMLVVAGVVAVIGVLLFTSLAVPGWATSAVGILVLLLGQLILFSGFFAFGILANRSTLAAVPIRDYENFVDSTCVVWSATPTNT